MRLDGLMSAESAVARRRGGMMASATEVKEDLFWKKNVRATHSFICDNLPPEVN